MFILAVVFISIFDQGTRVFASPSSCYEGIEYEVRTSDLYNKNISVCSGGSGSAKLQYCYKFSYNDQWSRPVNVLGCATASNQYCSRMNTIGDDYSCFDDINGIDGQRGRMCCTKTTKGWVAIKYRPVQNCHNGTTNSQDILCMAGRV
jgi:hypothetical protein